MRLEDFVLFLGGVELVGEFGAAAVINAGLSTRVSLEKEWARLGCVFSLGWDVSVGEKAI